MALHRALRRPDFTERSERLIAKVGATRVFGSPILALAERLTRYGSPRAVPTPHPPNPDPQTLTPNP